MSVIPRPSCFFLISAASNDNMAGGRTSEVGEAVAAFSVGPDLTCGKRFWKNLGLL